MRLTCPACGDNLEVDVDLKDGDQVRCASCGRIFAYRECDSEDVEKHQLDASGTKFRGLSGLWIVLFVLCGIGVVLVALHSMTLHSNLLIAGDEHKTDGEKLQVPSELQDEVVMTRRIAGQIVRYYGDPLGEYRLGEYSGSRQEDFEMRNFLFFNTMKITYTSKGRIALIKLQANDSERLSVANTDYIVTSLMKSCDAKFGPIEWDMKKQDSGRKCAQGRCFFRGRLDKIFVLSPTAGGGFDALLMSKRARCEDDGCECPDSSYE